MPLNMHNVGKKQSPPEVCHDIKEKVRIFYPGLSLNSEQVPELKQAKVDDEVTLVIKAVVTGAEKRRWDDNKIFVSLDIREVGIPNYKNKTKSSLLNTLRGI